jgi:hypothetical protein
MIESTFKVFGGTRLVGTAILAEGDPVISEITRPLSEMRRHRERWFDG